jgi:tRNA U38,U39,U40 pseudouridine synthase TruA
VVSVKLEVEPERFDADPEGLHLAQDVNRHLPPEVRLRRARRAARAKLSRSRRSQPRTARGAPDNAWRCRPGRGRREPARAPSGAGGGRAQVRVLSAQRVNRSFSARTDCRSRTYVYFLPAAALGLRLDGAPPPPPAARPPPARRLPRHKLRPASASASKRR